MVKQIGTWVMNQITINRNTLTYGHQTIRISNISSVNLQPIAKGNSNLLITGGVFFSIISLVTLFQSPKTLEAVFTILFFGALGGICLWSNSRQKQRSKQYELMIQTNAGTRQLFRSPDYTFVNRVRLMVLEALNSSSENSYVINLDNKTVINNTGTVNIVNVSKYQGLSQHDRQFLSTQFETALQRIQRELVKQNNQRLNAAFETLRQELATAKPRKNVLETAWSVLGNLGSLSELASIMDKAFNIF